MSALVNGGAAHDGKIDGAAQIDEILLCKVRDDLCTATTTAAAASTATALLLIVILVVIVIVVVIIVRFA